MNADELLAEGRPTGTPTFEPDAPPPGNTPGSLYKSYVADPTSDYLKIFLGNAGVPETLRGAIVGAVVPPTLTGALIDVGTMLMPGGPALKGASKAMPFLKRLVGPAVGGVVGGFLEEYNPEEAALGGALGVAQGTLGEMLSVGTQWLSKSRLGQQLAKSDPKNLDGAVKRVIKDFPDIKTPEGFQTAVYGGFAQRRMSDAYDTELGRIGDAVTKAIPPGGKVKAFSALGRPDAMVTGGGGITSPVIRQMQKQGLINPEMGANGLPKTTFESLTKDIRDLRLTGRAASGDPKVTLQGKQAQEAAEALSQEVEKAIGGISPGLAKRFQDMEHSYRRGAEMLRLLDQPGMIKDNGRLNMKLLQESFREERAAGVNRTFTPEEVQTLQEAIFRGAPATAVDKILKDVHKAALRVHGTVSEGARPGFFTNLADFLRHDQYVGNYKMPAPYTSPKAATLGVGLGAGGVQGMLSGKPPVFSSDKSAITLGADED